VQIIAEKSGKKVPEILAPVCSALYSGVMNIITTPQNNIAMSVAGGFSRQCGKCSGDGIYWRQVPTAHGYTSIPDVCFPCNGTGAVGKVFPTIEAFDKARANAEKAQARRDAKREAEWEAGREDREARKAAQELAIAQAAAELTEWKYLDAQIDDTVTITGTVTTAVEIETRFGYSRLIVVETDSKEAVKMFTTAAWAWEVERDAVVTIQGNVKSFDEYEGKAQTMLNYAKKI
jgi:hypothetical protein